MKHHFSDWGLSGLVCSETCHRLHHFKAENAKVLADCYFMTCERAKIYKRTEGEGARVCCPFSLSLLICAVNFQSHALVVSNIQHHIK